MNGPDPLRDAYALAEAIASRDLNNLYLTSRFFADPVRYRSFCADYAVMRRVDDRVDELCARSGVPAAERERVRAEVDAWRRAIAEVGAGQPVESAGRALGGLEDAASARALLLACADAAGRELAGWKQTVPKSAAAPRLTRSVEVGQNHIAPERFQCILIPKPNSCTLQPNLSTA